MGMASVAILGSCFVPSFYAMIASLSLRLFGERGSDDDEDENASEAKGTATDH